MADTEQGSDIRSDIAAVMDQVESAAPEPTPVIQEASAEAPATDVAPPVDAPAGERARNELGQFARKDAPPKAEKVAAPPVETPKPEAVKEPPKPPVEEKVEEVVPFEGAKPIQALRPSTKIGRAHV